MDTLKKYIADIAHAAVLILSVALIAYISYDTFKQIPLLGNHRYMVFQFWVCVIFIADFFIEWALSPDPKHYFKHRWFFLAVSLPYLNIINIAHLDLPEHVIYYLRYVPLVRGAYSLSMVVGYISSNRAVSLMAQYVALLLATLYILSMVFYYEEHGINPAVKTFWDALYWASMNMVTVGCEFYAVTAPGKVISVVLPLLGLMLLPLFTVYVTDKVRSYYQGKRDN